MPDAFVIGEKFIGKDNVAMILGDNFFYGQNLTGKLLENIKLKKGAKVVLHKVLKPELFGVAKIDNKNKIKIIKEKPKNFISDLAITGLYFVDGTASERARQVQPSERGELEITSLLESYLKEGYLVVEKMGRGFAWLDTGTHGSLLDAGNFVRTLTERQGLQVGSPDELAFQLGWITENMLLETAKMFGKNREIIRTYKLPMHGM